MKRWRGTWLISVALIHTVFALVMFKDSLQVIAARGVFNSVGNDPTIGAVSWFVLCGFCLAALGLAVYVMEHAGQRSRAVGVSLLLTVLLGLILMPASGFWLLLPPAISLATDSHRNESNALTIPDAQQRPEAASRVPR
jgi:hypothetical protein